MPTLLLLVAALGSAASARAQSTLPPLVDPAALDASVDPCSDFYQYACGAWLKNNPVPADQSSWYRSSALDEHTRDVLRAILAEDASEKDQTSADSRKLGDYYSACMNEPAINGLGLAPLKPWLDGVAAVKDRGTLAAEAGRLQVIGANALFSFGSEQDFNDAARMIGDADQGGFSLPDRDYYLLDDYKNERAEYLAHLKKMFVLLGDAPDAAAGEAATVLKVETALAKASMGRVERRVPKNVHHKLSRKDFEALAPSFDWPAFFAAIQSPAFDSLDVSDPGFFKGLETSLKTFSLDDWKTYLRWSAVQPLIPMLPTDLVAEDFDFFGRALGGEAELKPRWKRCVSYADMGMGEALGRDYVAREFPPQAKGRVEAMVAQIEAAMARDIRSSPWMGAKTRELALEKLAKVSNKLGYPDVWRDYAKLVLSPDDALGNMARADAFEFHRELDKIGGPTDRAEWEMSPPTDNAYYDPALNSINFPAGILQPPNFDMDADSAAVLGSIGATIGHELTHGFDDEGRHYDGDGNLKDWWTAADSKAFEARAQGFVDEYSGFVTVASTDPAQLVKLNGKLTLGENIADNGGLVLAWSVLNEEYPDGQGPRMDGFDPRQRFFISYGQSWCMNETDASKREMAKIDPHSTGKYRVNGVVSNMPEFARAFSCKAGSPMAPLLRNRVW